MKKNVGFFSTVCLTLLLLTACNTEEEQGMEPANEEITPTEEINKDEKTETNEKVNEPKETEDQLNPAQTEEAGVTNSNITYSTNGEEVAGETTTIDSDTYSLQVITGFTLVPEEPGKDMLYLEENDKVSMRIETVSVNQTTYDDMVANTEETMTAIGQYEPFAMDQYLGSHSEISKAAAYTVTFGTEKLVMIVFEKDGMIVRLTVYDETSVDLTDAMIKMGLTIQSK